MSSSSTVFSEDTAKLFENAHILKRKPHDFPPVASSAESKLVRVFSGYSNIGAWYIRTNGLTGPSFLKLPSTMTLYRSEHGELTIFNAQRVSEELEDEILALGTVAHVVKLGQYHGASDAYWVLSEKFNKPKYWTLEGGTVAEVRVLRLPSPMSTFFPTTCTNPIDSIRI